MTLKNLVLSVLAGSMTGCAAVSPAIDRYAEVKSDAIDAVAQAFDAKWVESLEWQCGRASIASYQRLAARNPALADRLDAVCVEYKRRGWRSVPRGTLAVGGGS